MAEGTLEDLASQVDPLSALVRRIRPDRGRFDGDDVHARREWLVTNGLGGYASGTVAGAITRRFHGLLISSCPAPLGRVMLLNHVSERLQFADRSVEWLAVSGRAGRLAQEEGLQHLVEFRLDAGIPTWRYQVRGVEVERTVHMPYGQNTVHITYRMSGGKEPVRLTLCPLLGFRRHEAPVDLPAGRGYTLTARDRRIEIDAGAALPTLRLALHAEGGAFTVDDHAIADVRYLLEESRGYDHTGSLWSPGYFRADLRPGTAVTLIASAEPWDAIAAVNPDEALAAERGRRARLVSSAIANGTNPEISALVLAADQFIVRPATRTEAETRTGIAGGDAHTVIAGYHWFTDWGRDTMIALEGLTLVTGRHAEARDILLTFADHMRDGLIPNLFPEGGREGLYHTADATLWFYHALSRYEAHSGDTAFVRTLLPRLVDSVDRHVAGTSFGIRVDADGLLTQGAEGYQLTWMDAKVDDWVVTPRRGKAVEINALWYNALCVLGRWLRQSGDVARATDLETRALTCKAAFNRRFWNEATGHLFDVVDGAGDDDPACRPNQVLAIALPHPVLDRQRWEQVLGVVTARLLTPFGLRSLSPEHPDYKVRYFGDLRSRDAAYHQGTVWTWLIGPYVDAWLATHPGDLAGARRHVEGLLVHLDEACIGSVSEIVDAEPPFTPRGCIAQAWGVAELLRILSRTRAATA